MRRTAVEKAEFIDKEYREYLRSSYSFGNDIKTCMKKD